MVFFAMVPPIAMRMRARAEWMWMAAIFVVDLPCGDRGRVGLAVAPFRDAPEEFDVAEHVAPPQAAGVLHQAERPFEAGGLHPLRSAGGFSGEDFKAAADADGDRDFERANVGVDKEFLFRRTESYEEDIRLRFCYIVENALQHEFILFKTPIGTRDSGDNDAGVGGFEDAGGFGGRSGAASEEEDSHATAGPERPPK